MTATVSFDGDDERLKARTEELVRLETVADSEAMEDTIYDTTCTPPDEMVDGGYQQLIEQEQLEEHLCSECYNSLSSEEDKALQLLIEATSMFRSCLRGAVLSVRTEALKEVSELTGVPSTIIYHAYRHGVLKAHNMYIKEDYKKNVKLNTDVV